MERMLKGIFVVFVLCLFLSSQLVSAPVPGKQVDTKKLYEEISGRYEFNADGQVIIINFHVKDGSLYGTSEGDGEEVELEPVEIESMSFETTDNDGEFYEITFSKDEDKEITKCVVLTGGMELVGTKIKE